MNNHILTSLQQSVKNTQCQGVVGLVVLAGFCNGNEVKGVDVHFRFSVKLFMEKIFTGSQQLIQGLIRGFSMKNINDLLQHSLPMLMLVPPPKRLDEILINSLNNFGEAVALCVKVRVCGLTQQQIANYLGFSNPHFTKVLQGKGYLSADQISILERLCSNKAISQYQEKVNTVVAEAVETKDQKLERLQEELRIARSA